MEPKESKQSKKRRQHTQSTLDAGAGALVLTRSVLGR